MPTPPPDTTPVVVWILTCAVVFLGLVCSITVGIIWRGMRRRPEEVLAASAKGLAALRAEIVAAEDACKELGDQLGRLREDSASLKNHRRAVDKLLEAHGRWMDGLAQACQDNRDDIRALENDVGRLQEEQGWTPVPRKVEREHRKRRPVPRGRPPIALGGPDDDDTGKGA